MADARAPVAIRVSRPFASDEELLDHEADTISRAGIVLIGAPARPEGTVLRFEVTLNDGGSLMRGEGRVTGTKVVNGEQGLALRFTRLDSKSKALVDRAVAIREARANKPTSSASLPPNPIASEPNLEESVDRVTPPPVPPPLPAKPETVVSHPPPPVAASVASPSDRSGALDRLRDRAKKLTPEQIGELLKVGRTRTNQQG
jgi:hypothetical protein